MTVIALGADHAGFALKEHLKGWLGRRGDRILDCGTDSADPVDYPDYAAAVAAAVSTGRAARGLLVCGTGIGMAMAANKITGIRAAVCGDAATARLAREHNDANVLALGARVIASDAAVEVARAWLEAPFLGGRHAVRLAKLASLETGRAGSEGHVPAR